MLESAAEGIPHLRVWLRVWSHPDARIQPLDARTVSQANSARVWVYGAPSAYLQRREGRWELSAAGEDLSPKIYGSSALEAVINWLSLSEEYQS